MTEFRFNETERSRVDKLNALARSLGSPAPVAGPRMLVIGTSLVQQNDVATSAKISHWNRGWLTQARFFSRGRFFTPIWSDLRVYSGWEPSGTPGATRGFSGLNGGVSGQTLAQIINRVPLMYAQYNPQLVVLDAGTNDMGVLTKEAIHNGRIWITEYFTSRGVPVILLPILSRGTTSWASGSAERKKAAWVNASARAYAAKSVGVYYYDWNRKWVDFSSANGVPRSGFSPDDIHFSTPGGVAVGEDFALFVQSILPEPNPRVWSPDDKFDATHNPFGNLLTNPFCTGTGGSHGTGSTGTNGVATGMRSEISSGSATVVASKETRSDGRGDWQVLTYTPGAADSLAYYRTSTADTTHTYPAGAWVQASVEVEIGSFNGWQGVSLYVKDNGTNGLIAYGMEPYDAGAGLIKLPTRAMNGLITTPPIQLVSGSTSLRWRLEARIGSTGGGASGTGVLKVGAIELRQVADPRSLVLRSS